MEQFPDLLEYNTLKGCSLIVGGFNFHYDVPTNTYTSWLIDLLDSFNLRQSVTTPTHRSGHILDWVRPIHRKDDDTLLILSATTSPTLQSDHCSVLTQLKILQASTPRNVYRGQEHRCHRPQLLPIRSSGRTRFLHHTF